MKTVRTENAVGMILGQDLTRIAPGEFKGVAFKKGHIIQEADVPVMLSMGKDHVYIIEFGPGEVHENDAAAIIAEAAIGSGLEMTEAAEGKVSMKARYAGLLKVNKKLLSRINHLEGIALSTIHSDSVVQEGETVASAKIIPLMITQGVLDTVAKEVRDAKILEVLPFPKRKIGLIITGNEVYYGRIQDKFEKIIKGKLKSYDADIVDTTFTPDDPEQIASAVNDFAIRSDIVIACGGMSVDPDDVTPEGIRRTKARIIAYGTPVLPGAMFLVAYKGQKPILGLPACGMYSKTTILDIVLPKVIAGEKITKKYISGLGHGGLCRQCSEGCRYPACSFGK